jgi:hypothetical protein
VSRIDDEVAGATHVLVLADADAGWFPDQSEGSQIPPEGGGCGAGGRVLYDAADGAVAGQAAVVADELARLLPVPSVTVRPVERRVTGESVVTCSRGDCLENPSRTLAAGQAMSESTWGTW